MAAKANLKIVPTTTESQPPATEAETVAARIARLQTEARRLAAGQTDALCDLLDQAAEQARLIAAGGDAFPVGVRELASRMADDLPNGADTLRAIASRSR